MKLSKISRRFGTLLGNPSVQSGLVILAGMTVVMVAPALADSSDPFAPLATGAEQAKTGIKPILSYIGWFGLVACCLVGIFSKGKFPVAWLVGIGAAFLILGIGPSFLTWAQNLGGG